MMMHRKLVYMQMHPGSYLHHAGGYGGGMYGFGLIHIIVFAVVAGIAGFVFAAVYNSLAASRPN
jgi:uncharacterized membrane protein